MHDKEYQDLELGNFLKQNCRYYDNVRDFSDYLENTDILEQIEWIENGTYGAGACFFLQHILNRITKRMNREAAIGQAVLRIFYGAPFGYWRKLAEKAKTDFSEAVRKWDAQEREWSMTYMA